MNTDDVLQMMRRVAESRSQPTTKLQPPSGASGVVVAAAPPGISTPFAAEGSYSTAFSVKSTPSLTPQQALELQQVKVQIRDIVMLLEEQRSDRVQLDAAIQHERDIMFSREQSARLLQCDREIAELAAERERMADWLRRGIREASRMSEDAQDSKKQLENCQIVGAEAASLNSDMKTNCQITENEIVGLLESRSECEREISDLRERQTRSIQEMRQGKDDANRLASETALFANNRVVLKSHARRLEVVEVGMSCLGAALRRTDFVLRQVTSAVVSGHMNNLQTLDDGFDSEEDAPLSTFPVQIYPQLRGIASGCVEHCGHLSDLLSHFSDDQRDREREAATEHIQRLAAARAAIEDARGECTDLLYEERVVVNELETFREQLLQFVSEHLESIQCQKSPPRTNFSFFSNGDADTNDVDSEISFSAASRAKSRFDSPRTAAIKPKKSALEQIEDTNTHLQDSIKSLSDSNARWKVKVANQEEDYASLKSLRVAYRDMEAKKMLLGIDIRESEQQNKELKLAILDFSDSYST